MNLVAHFRISFVVATAYPAAVRFPRESRYFSRFRQYAVSYARFISDSV